MRPDAHRLVVEGLEPIDPRAVDRLVVIGLGKAAAPMAAAAIECLGREPDRGLVVTKDGHAEPVPGCVLLETAHPVPDARAIDAVERLLALVADLGRDDLVLCCLTGGASALVGAPADGVTLADLRATIDLLLASGADIQAVNTVRRHLTRLGGGGLLAAAAPTRVVTLAISDVLGNQPHAIGSGPTWSDPTTFADARAACRAAGIWDRLPPSVRTRLEDGIAGRVEDTLKPDDPRLSAAGFHIAAGNADAMTAAADIAARAGYEVVRLEDPLEGDAAAAGRAFARRLIELAQTRRRVALVAGGETTVVLPSDHGLGGRNQHFALAAARELRGHPLHLLAAGTDGTDGPTDAAGAIVDGGTWDRLDDPETALARCDAHPALDAIDALLRSGPTGTNVMDIVVGLAGGH